MFTLASWKGEKGERGHRSAKTSQRIPYQPRLFFRTVREIGPIGYLSYSYKSGVLDSPIPLKTRTREPLAAEIDQNLVQRRIDSRGGGQTVAPFTRNRLDP